MTGLYIIAGIVGFRGLFRGVCLAKVVVARRSLIEARLLRLSFRNGNF